MKRSNEVNVNAQKRPCLERPLMLDKPLAVRLSLGWRDAGETLDVMVTGEWGGVAIIEFPEPRDDREAAMGRIARNLLVGDGKRIFCGWQRLEAAL